MYVPPHPPQVLITGCSMPTNGAPFRSIVIPQSSEVSCAAAAAAGWRRL
jgi:hypothetical protein